MKDRRFTKDRRFLRLRALRAAESILMDAAYNGADEVFVHDVSEWSREDLMRLRHECKLLAEELESRAHRLHYYPDQSDERDRACIEEGA